MTSQFNSSSGSTQVQNSVALVTGANRGIGLALVQALLTRGARKIYAGMRDVSSQAELFHQSDLRLADARDRIVLPCASTSTTRLRCELPPQRRLTSTS